MSENKVINHLVCNAMPKMAKKGLCHQNKTEIQLVIFQLCVLFFLFIDVLLFNRTKCMHVNLQWY